MSRTEPNPRSRRPLDTCDLLIGGSFAQNRPRQARNDLVEGGIAVKAIVVTDQEAGRGGMTLVDRPEPRPAINDVVVRVRASGFVPTEMAWPSTWVDRAG